MRPGWTNSIFFVVVFLSCQQSKSPDGFSVQDKYLLDNNLRQDFSASGILPDIINQVNCIDSGLLGKRIALASQFYSTDTNQILLIPFVSNGNNFGSSAYSDIANRVILLNPTYIRTFALKNTLNDTTAFHPLIVLMLLHEMGHFILGQPGFFDRLASKSRTGEQVDNTQPELLTKVKKVELSADSLAIDMVKRRLKESIVSCGGKPFDIELIVPGMEFQLSGRRMIDHFGSSTINFLHDPTADHPNLELRITFMNYFLHSTDTLRAMIDNYLYERVVAPVHRQELDPSIFQGQEKKL